MNPPREESTPQLLERWRSERSARQREVRRFLHQLKSRRGAALDRRAAELHEQTFARLDCLACANCCRSIPPIVNRADARRIARHLRMTEGEFHARYLTRDEDGDTVINASPCPFLEQDNRCAIYEHRPRACRAYPHTDEDFSAQLGLHLRNIVYCPGVFRIMEQLMR
jgi:Fe-S-cluster containining protein